MSDSTIDASAVKVSDRQERETTETEITVDLAVALPSIDDTIYQHLRIDFNYNAIVSSVNDYIRRSVIDDRIEGINYSLTIPRLPDQEATQNLKDVLTGEKNIISTPNGNVSVNNKAISDNKVTLKFELSIEETVYFENESGESKVEKVPAKGETVNGNNSPAKKNNESLIKNKDLVIKSSEPKLYWKSAPVARVEVIKESNTTGSTLSKTDIIDGNLTAAKNIGGGIDSSMSAVKGKAFNQVKEGNNGNIYFKSHARGNKYYKIVGKIGDNPTVKRLGIAGKVVSYGSTTVKAGIDMANAGSIAEGTKIAGGALGEMGTSFVAGSAASAVTTTVLVSLATVAGIASAPVTVLVIGGCAIFAGVAASNATEGYGRELGENIVEKYDLGNKLERTIKDVKSLFK